jgi:WD40 repeat protein
MTTSPWAAPMRWHSTSRAKFIPARPFHVLFAVALIVQGACAVRFARADDVATAIFVMQTDGGQLRRVAEVAGYKRHGSPHWSHDGARLAFDASEGPGGARKVFVVNVDGSGLQEAGEHAMPRWSPDDKQLAFHNYGGAGLKRGVWVQNVDGKSREWITDGFCPRWSPDGGRIVYSAARALSVLDMVQGEELPLLEDAFEEIYYGMDWSPDGQRIAFVGRRDGPRELWIVDARGAAKGSKLRSSGNLGGNVAWSPDGKRLAIIFNQRIHLIDPESSDPPGEPITGQSGDNREPAWSPDGKWLAFSSDRRTPTLVAKPAGKRSWKLEELARHPKGSIVYGAAFTPDGLRLVMGGDPISEGVQVWNRVSGETRNLGGQGVSVAMFPDGRRFATSWISPLVQVINIDSGEVVRELNHGNTVRSIAVSKDGNRLVSAGLDNTLRVWDTNTGDEVCTFDGHKEWITRAVFSPDGNEVFSAGQGKQVCLWDARTGQSRIKLNHPDTVWGLAVSPDGRQIVTGTGGAYLKHPVNLYIDQSPDNVIRLWDAADGRMIRAMGGHTHAVYTLDISPDGRLAVSGSWDGTMRLWELASGNELARAEGWKGSVMKVLFSPDGKQIIAGGGVSRSVAEVVDYPDEQVRVFKLVEVAGADGK